LWRPFHLPGQEQKLHARELPASSQPALGVQIDLCDPLCSHRRSKSQISDSVF
jgi:hypothetical protein